MSAELELAAPNALELPNNEPPVHDIAPLLQPRRECEQPRLLFALLTVLFVATFVDKGLIATNAINGLDGSEEEEDSGLRGDMEMSNFQNGLLSSALIVGVIAGSPLTWLALPRLPPLSVIGLGMLLWCAAAVGCGLFRSFFVLLACRFLIGVGQFPIFFLGSILLHEAAPETKTMQWLTFYLLSGPIGLAFGFFLGRTVVEYTSWHYAFLIEAGTVLPFALTCFAIRPFDVQRWAESDNTQRTEGRQGDRNWTWTNLKQLMRHTVFDLAVLGGALHMGFVTILEYWGARVSKALFDESTVDLYQGAFMAVGIIAGCLLGGFALEMIGSSLSNALYVSSTSCLVSSAIVIFLVLSVTEYMAFMGVLLVAYVALFFLQGPLGGAAVWSVPPNLQSLSRDMHQLVQQVIFAAPAPALYGLFVDLLNDRHDLDVSHKVALSFSTILLFMSAILFCIAGCISMERPDDQNSSPQENAHAA